MDDLDLAMDPLSVGRLGYASGDPVNLTDDDGHFSDFCQGVCVKANGQSYQSHGYASPGGVRVNTINGNKYDNQYQGFYATGCNTACHARAAAAEAATKARWEAAQALRRKKVYAQRRAHYQKSCSENPQKSHCAKYRKEHHIKTLLKAAYDGIAAALYAHYWVPNRVANQLSTSTEGKPWYIRYPALTVAASTAPTQARWLAADCIWDYIGPQQTAPCHDDNVYGPINTAQTGHHPGDRCVYLPGQTHGGQWQIAPFVTTHYSTFHRCRK